MRRIIPFLLLFLLPLAAWADGMVIPTIAYPAQVTIPDQQALICFSNGVERLVIETRFTGTGTNFAWVVPLPSQPVIEEATTGLFPTLRFLCRPEIIHEVPRYYMGVLVLVGFIYIFWRAKQSIWNAFGAAFLCLLLLLLFSMLLLPALSRSRSAGITTAFGDSVSILNRKIVGIFETATITSRDPRALENWLRDNGFAIASDASPVIADYLKDGWVFVATKVRRDTAGADTSTPHPLSFTFKTSRPVYPMRLTGLTSKSLNVDLYVFGNTAGTAPHFKVESCGRRDLFHPLLCQWFGSSAVVTKLTATLSPADMRKDVWLELPSVYFEHKNRLYSRQGALTTALNWGAGVFAIGLLVVCGLVLGSKTPKTKIPQRVGTVILASMIVVGADYLTLPKTDVKLVRGRFYSYWRQEQVALCMALDNYDWHTTAEARAVLQGVISNPTNAAAYGLNNMDNYFVGGQIREEDSPGNYLLRETNHQLQLVFCNRDGGEDFVVSKNLSPPH
jgi:hypothetical protein